MNNVVLSGKLFRYEERQVNGKDGPLTIGNFSISVSNEKKNDKSSSFFNVEVWNPKQELVDRLNTWNGLILVVGKLRQDTWKDKNTNQKRSVVKVVASQVAILDGTAREEQPEPEPEPEPAPPPPPPPPAPRAPAPRPTAQPRPAAPVARKAAPRPAAPPPPPPVNEPDGEEPVDEVPDDSIPF